MNNKMATHIIYLIFIGNKIILSKYDKVNKNILFHVESHINYFIIVITFILIKTKIII